MFVQFAHDVAFGDDADQPVGPTTTMAPMLCSTSPLSSSATRVSGAMVAPRHPCSATRPRSALEPPLGDVDHTRLGPIMLGAKGNDGEHIVRRRRLLAA